MTASLILVPSVPAISQALDVKVMPTPEKDKSQILIVQNTPEQIIKFKTGSHSAIVSGGIPRGTVNTYVLEAKKGQTISLTITSIENNVVFQILAPKGKSIVKEKANFSGKLPRSGKYKIVVEQEAERVLSFLFPLNNTKNPGLCHHICVYPICVYPICVNLR